MTTLRQIRSLVVPLLSRHHDLALAGPVIAIRPVHHLLRFILIDRTGEAERFRPRWSATELFSKLNHFPVGLGDMLRRPGLWLWTDPEIAQVFAEVAERTALPKLRAIQTLQDYRDLALPKSRDERKHYWGLQLLSGLALGELHEVRQLLAETPEAVAMLNRNRAGLGGKLLALGPDVTRKDRAEIAGLLHEWEAYSVHKLDLGKVWERTPFPIERGA